MAKSNGSEEQAPTIIVSIEFDPNTNQVRLTAPMENRMLVYGMLEMARDIVHAQQGAPVRRSPILVPRAGM